MNDDPLVPILIDHTRDGAGECDAGCVLPLGSSFAAHVAERLRAELAKTDPAPPLSVNVQHRLGQPTFVRIEYAGLPVIAGHVHPAPAPLPEAPPAPDEHGLYGAPFAGVLWKFDAAHAQAVADDPSNPPAVRAYAARVADTLP